MILDPIYIQIALLVLTLLGCTALVYIIVILVRVNTLLGKVQNIVSYVERIQAILTAWESIPAFIFQFIKDALLSLQGGGEETKKSKKK